VGLEAPFIGREHELHAIIETSEASARDRRARLVAVVGEAGSGKSRLLWEYFKYLDGIEELRWWHQGRCLSYGEGVAYWALAEMVRSRAGIMEEESPDSAREKLGETVRRFVSEERERRLVEPRLAHLLRLEERPDADRVDLFSGWRLFFERMAESNPVILAFEDLEWADSGLLDFIDYVLEWSADNPIFVLALGRPELRERRPLWEPLVLEPLAPAQTAKMLGGLAPGLPDDLVAEIVTRAEGIPLYAVEMVRMLQDRGLLVQEGSRYRVNGDVSHLDVPETLHALVASRLDGLSDTERVLLQDASVLGQSLTPAGVAALSGMPEAEVKRLLDGLVVKQVLSRDDDPRSPDRGQYVFLQALLRTVAYGTLSRRTRKARHVAAARHLEQTWPGEARDIAEVLASHYLEAIRAEPDADDVSLLRASARTRLATAGQAAASLGLGPEATHYLDQAAELADDDLERAALLEQAGRALRQSGDVDDAERRLRAAMELYQRGGVPTGGRAAVELARHLRVQGRMEEALPLLERFRSDDDPHRDPVLRAEAAAELGAVLVFAGRVTDAGPLFDEALMTLEEQQSWPALADALVNRAVYLILNRRRREGGGVLREARALAEENDLPAVVLRATVNLAQVSIEQDQFGDALEELREGLVVARERGDKLWERQLSSQLLPPLYRLGRWDEAAPVCAGLLSGQVDLDALAAAAHGSGIAAAREDRAMLERCLSIAEEHVQSAYVDMRIAATIVYAHEAAVRGAQAEALRLAKTVLGTRIAASESFEEAYLIAIEAVLAADDPAAREELVELVDALPPARATTVLRAGRGRLLADAAHSRGDDAAARRHEEEAIALLRSVGARPLLASVLLDRARRHGDGEALAEARAIYTELDARRGLARLDEHAEVPAG
jgi:tetratricopeptide (TPR) repeat protein